jgi:DNA-binding response OmpR family regulator
MASSAKSHYRSQRSQWKPTEPVARPLSGVRVLIVDDEFLIAAQLQCDFRAAGAEVIGPSHTLKDALALAKRDRPTAAILDIHLGPDDISPLTQELSDRGIPFVFYTGQSGTDRIRAQWPTSKFISKPAPADRLIGAIVAMVKR